METMNKFKVGDRIVRVRKGSINVPQGYQTKVLNGYEYTCFFGSANPICDDYWELASQDIKPKWTIYNNTLPWSQLSDKQKGKLLLAAHAKMLFCDFGLQIPGFALVNCVYKVEEPVKPEPTMAELLTLDILSCSGFLRPHDVNDLIAKGWTKPCK
jgi:hypothetical protein